MPTTEQEPGNPFLPCRQIDIGIIGKAAQVCFQGQYLAIHGRFIIGERLRRDQNIVIKVVRQLQVGTQYIGIIVTRGWPQVGLIRFGYKGWCVLRQGYCFERVHISRRDKGRNSIMLSGHQSAIRTYPCHN